MCLDVLAELDDLEPDHPDAVAVRRATARVYKSVKQRRRSSKRASVTAADEAVTNLTATTNVGVAESGVWRIVPCTVNF